MIDDPTQQVPHSREAEEALIGCILVDPECLRDVDLQPDEMYIHRNQWIYQAALEMRCKGQNIDFVTLSEVMDKRGQLAECGGRAYLSDCQQHTPISLNAASYAGIIRENAKRRQMLAIANQIARDAYNRERDINQAIPEAIDKLSRSVIVSDGAVHISQFVNQLYDEISQAAKNPKDIFGYATGCLDYDTITGGLQKGEVVKLIGDPGAGKSLLAFQWACELAKQVPGAVYELEMRGVNVVRRQASSISKVTTKAMRSGRVKDNEWPAVIQSIEEMSKYDIYLSDRSDWTTTALRVDLERLIANHGIGWVVIDYEGLICDDPDKDDIARSKVISSRVHAMVKDLGLAALVIDEMNKAGVSNPNAGKANLAGSARKIFDADSIIVLKHNPDKKDQVTITWDKFREDEGDGIVFLRKVPGFPTFQNVYKGK